MSHGPEIAEALCVTCGQPLSTCPKGGRHEESGAAPLSEGALFGDIAHEPSSVQRDAEMADLRAVAQRLRSQIMGHVKRLDIELTPLGKSLDRYLNLADQSMVARAGRLEATVNEILRGAPNEVQLERVLKVLIAARAKEEQPERDEASEELPVRRAA